MHARIHSMCGFIKNKSNRRIGRFCSFLVFFVLFCVRFVSTVFVCYLDNSANRNNKRRFSLTILLQTRDETNTSFVSYTRNIYYLILFCIYLFIYIDFFSFGRTKNWRIEYEYFVCVSLCVCNSCLCLSIFR